MNMYLLTLLGLVFNQPFSFLNPISIQKDTKFKLSVFYDYFKIYAFAFVLSASSLSTLKNTG
jgi:hypothetical protein